MEWTASIRMGINYTSVLQDNPAASWILRIENNEIYHWDQPGDFRLGGFVGPRNGFPTWGVVVRGISFN